jgi:electron transport complex protein RnfC
MGGAGFPAHVKLSPPPEKKIDTLIINGAECEPYLTSDERVMIEHAEKIWKGVEIIRKILGVEHIRIAIEDNKPDAIATMEKAGSYMEGDTGIVVLESIYPQGAEKQLIYAITGREVPSGGLPMDVGVLVHNVSTAMAICIALTEGLPLVQRIVTVSGDCVKDPKNVLAPVGASLNDIINFCGGLKEEPAKVICGGPMMGIALPSLEPGISKTTSGILLFSSRLVKQFASMPCISCGRCLRACPMHLMPNELSQFVEAEDWIGAESYNILDCIECGSCAFECPAHRPLVQHMKFGKNRVIALRKEREAKKT